MTRDEQIQDYFWFARHLQKIKTKMDGLQNLRLRKYQIDFYNFMQDIKGPKRIIVLKPRQAGFSTQVASIFSHRMQTSHHYNGLMMADKFGRTEEVAGIYRNFIETTPDKCRPDIGKLNSDEIFYSSNKSGVKFETANDPNAGRSGTRKFAHQSEAAFYRYFREIDEGLQNSIPLHSDTCIIKESTANGRAGIGEAFHSLWYAAKRGDSLYKAFFVAWYEIDDYQIQPEHDFKPTKEEIDLLKQCPDMTEANLMWRRLKLKEYLADEEDAFLTPSERFNQDFPWCDDVAYRSTGAPVYPVEITSQILSRLNANKPIQIQDRLSINSSILKQFMGGLRIFAPPRTYMKYYIGADVAEGLAQGDSSSLFILDQNYRQVGRWHGKIDPDMFGFLLMELGYYYNTALLIPEVNNMGHTTVTTIKNEGYPLLYREEIEDKITSQRVDRYGWRTTKTSKMDMINESIARLREKDVTILDVRLVEELAQVSREENGTINLNGKDRVVAFCLACMGAKHFKEAIYTPKQYKPETFGDIGRKFESSNNSDDFN